MGFDFSKFYCILLLLQMILFSIARVAQGIEQQFPKLLVGGSIPLSGTIFISLKISKLHKNPTSPKQNFHLSYDTTL